MVLAATRKGSNYNNELGYKYKGRNYRQIIHIEILQINSQGFPDDDIGVEMGQTYGSSVVNLSK